MKPISETRRLTKLKELTPSKYKCTYGCCPAVFKSDDGTITIIGKKLSPALAEQIREKIGDDEWAIIIDPELLSNI